MEVVKKQRQREVFIELLEENKVLLKLNGLSKYFKICNALAKCDYKRFMAVDEKDRKEVFQDYVEELFQTEQEQKLANQQQEIEAIKELLQKYVGDGLG